MTFWKQGVFYLFFFFIFHITGCSPHPSFIRLSLPPFLYLTFIVSPKFDPNIISRNIVCDGQKNKWAKKRMKKKCTPQYLLYRCSKSCNSLQWVQLNHIRPVIRRRRRRTCCYKFSSIICWKAPFISFCEIQFIHSRWVESSPLDKLPNSSLLTECHLVWTHTRSGGGLSLLMGGL